jgi:hypothetical protein
MRVSLFSSTLRATKEKSGHCPRCREDVRTVQPWPHWRKVRYGYFGMLGVALFGTPVILIDGFVMIPLLMLFMAAIGPLNSLIGKPSTCAQCGAPVEALRRLRVIPGEATGPSLKLRRLGKQKKPGKLDRPVRAISGQEHVRDRDSGPEHDEQEPAAK